MNILQVCFRMPWPLKDGGAIAMYNITKGLAEAGCRLTLLVPSTKKHNISENKLPAELSAISRIHTVMLKTDITLMGAFLNLFSSKPYYLSRYESENFRKKLIEILKAEEFDVIILESLKVSMYADTVRRYSNAPLVLRSHNIEYLIWQRMAEGSKGLKKIFLKIMVSRLKRFESSVLNSVDAIASITDTDAAYFRQMGCVKPMITVPSGIDFSKYQAEPEKAEPSTLFHLGAMDWMANCEGVNWFIKEVWPLIHKRFPEYTFYLAGRNMPQDYFSLHIPGVEVIGEVPDAIEFIKSKSIMVVPLLSGSGMRIKVAEGMALGKVIISTSIGAEGIPCEHEKSILIADRPEEFVAVLDKMTENPTFQENISRNALSLARDIFDNQKIISDFSAFLQSLQNTSLKL